MIDTESGVGVLVWGCTGTPCVGVDDTLWRYALDDGVWTERAEGLDSEIGFAAAYDVESDVVVIMEWVFFDMQSTSTTWLYDADTDMLTASEAAAPRLGAGAQLVYDSGSDRVVAFGGVGVDDDELVYTEGTWTYDASTDSWEEKSPDVSPPPINFQAMGYDAGSDRTVLFGITDENVTEFWAYDAVADVWEELSLEDGPPEGSVYARAVYDPGSDRLLFYGGLRPDPAAPGGLIAHHGFWAYDYDSGQWVQLLAAEGQAPQTNYGADFDPATNRIVYFGGGDSWDDFYGDEMWVYDPASESWSQLGPTQG